MSNVVNKTTGWHALHRDTCSRTSRVEAPYGIDWLHALALVAMTALASEFVQISRLRDLYFTSGGIDD